ncbi:MAG: DHH family phosphoesterase [Deltaproteobacteria bacterium]|nr:DHH family phosphoesterase [Deltaproteobacteria bacterium]
MPELDQTLTIEERVKILLDVVEPGERVLVCTHDNPDPDSIASAYALGRLLEAKRGCSFTLTFGGVLGRAENRTMVRMLKLPLVPIHRVCFDDFDVVGLLDTQPEVTNHGLTPERTAGKKMICIDHHPTRPLSKEAAFADVGGDFGATSTLLTRYLHAAGVEPDRELATALFYGIKSDTRDLGREVSDDDLWAYSHLVPRTDMPAVSAIEHPPLPRAYFTVLGKAIERAKVYESVAVCDLGRVYVPDLVPEVADKLVSAEGIRWAIVVGDYKQEIYASLRVGDRRYSAGKLVREVIKKYPAGGAGGHGSMAGARLPYSERTKSPRGRTRARRKFLRELALATGLAAEVKAERFAPAPMDDNKPAPKNGAGWGPKTGASHPRVEKASTIARAVDPKATPAATNGASPKTATRAAVKASTKAAAAASKPGSSTSKAGTGASKAAPSTAKPSAGTSKRRI